MLRYPQEYLDDVMVKFAYNSNAIEGNTFKLRWTKSCNFESNRYYYWNS